MADTIGIGNSGSIDINKWKKLTAREIIKEESKGEEIPSEIIAWAQQMTAFSRIPDNVTYEKVDGDTGLDALEKLGIEDVDNLKPDAVKTEEPDAVKEPDETEKTEIAEENPENIPTENNDESFENELDLANPKLTTDPEVIRKRKERKGLA